MKMRRSLLTMSLTTAIALLAIGSLAPSPAAAHEEFWYYYFPPMAWADSYATVDSDHDHLTVCDTDADGEVVYAYYRTSEDYSQRFVEDGNGSKSGCGHAYAASGEEIVKVQMCVDTGGYAYCFREYNVD
jgi:hypothetical protein